MKHHKESHSKKFVYRLNVVMLILCAFLMIQPTTYPIMLGLYIVMAIPLWVFKLDTKVKLLWTIVPMSIPTFLYLVYLLQSWVKP
jgi:hypothetical protein